MQGAERTEFAGGPVDLSTPQIEEIDRRILAISDSSRRPVTRIDLDLTSSNFTWDGRLADGQPAVPDINSYTIEGYKDGQMIQTAHASAFTRVTEVRIENGEQVLVLSGGVTMNASEATALREN